MGCKLQRKLILYNDNVNTFDDVIMALIEICNHTFEQAGQCALITHYKGKCEVMSGVLDELETANTQLSNRNILVKIE